MARDFVAASNQYLQVDVAPVTAVPFTVAGWFYADEGGDVMWFLGDKDVANHWYMLEARGDGGFNFEVNAGGGGSGPTGCITTTSLALNTWHHGCGVAAAVNDRRVYLDGGGKNTATASRTVAGIDRVTIGRMGDSTPTVPWDGMLAEFAMWNVALTDAEVLELALGALPCRIRPASLVKYWPIMGAFSPEPCVWSGTDPLGVTGATAAASHPPMRDLYPVGGKFTYVAPAANELMRRNAYLRSASRGAWM